MWEDHGPGYAAAVATSGPFGEQEIRQEILFCLLGGYGVPYELAHSAAKVLWRRGVFGAGGRTGARLERLATDLLSRPMFEPRKQDGSQRRYRFPKRKAHLIRRAEEWMRELPGSSVRAALATCRTEIDRRDALCDCPGIGLKTASWILRNTGLGERLAILDVHVVRAMVGAGVLSGSERFPRDYIKVEGQFLAWCDDLGAEPAAFDLLIWEHQRGEVSWPKSW